MVFEFGVSFLFTFTSIDIIDPYTSDVYGTATILANGNITINLNTGLVLNKIYLYIGTLTNFETLPGNNYCPAYETWQFIDPKPNVNPVTITPAL